MKKTILLLIMAIFIVPNILAVDLISQQVNTDSSSAIFNPTNNRGWSMNLSRDISDITFAYWTANPSTNGGYCFISLYSGNYTNIHEHMTDSNGHMCNAVTNAGWTNFTFNATILYGNTTRYYFLANRTGVPNRPDVAWLNAGDGFANGSYSVCEPIGTSSCSHYDADDKDFMFQLYGTGLVSGFAVTATAPSTDTWTNADNIYLNYTPIAANPYSQCKLYTNYTGAWIVNQTNISAIVDSALNSFVWGNMSDGIYIWGVWCNDSTGTSAASSNLTIKIDTVNPIITVTSPTNLSYHDNTITVDMQCSDNSVYILNYTIYNGSNIMHSFQNTTTNQTVLTLKNTLNISNYTTQTYYMNVSCSDGHTIKEWDPVLDYEYVSDGVVVTVDSGDKLEIKITDVVGDGKFDKFKPIKLKDRLIFNLTFDDVITSFTYEIKADKYVQYFGDYSGHFILNDKYWFDTEPYEPSNIELKNGKVYLTISGLNTDKIITESIGGLNIVEQQYELYIDHTDPSVSDIRFRTTNGSTSGPVVYGNYIDYINATCSDSTSVGGCYVVVTRPNNSTKIDNLSMSSYHGFNYSYSSNFMLDMDGNWTINVTAYDQVNRHTSHTRSFEVLYYTNESHDPMVIEGSYVNVSIYFANITNATLTSLAIYNGSAYSPVYSYYDEGRNIVKYVYTVIAPNLTSDSLIQTYYYNYTYIWNNGTQIDAGYTTQYNQSISKGYVVQCGGISNTSAINFSFYNEDTLVPIKVSGDFIFDIWVNDPTNPLTYTFNFSDRYNYSICISPNNANFVTNAYLKYTHDTGFTHKYYLRSSNITNETQLISLYNFNTTSGLSDLKGEVRDEDTYAYFPNVYASLLRYYPASNTWRIVQMDRSDEFGQIFFNVKEESEDYQIVFNHNLYNIYTTNELKFICTSGICQLTFLMDQYDPSTDSVAPPYSYSYNNATGIVTLTWNDPTGTVNTVRLMVLKNSYNGFTTICDNSLNSAAGSLSCNISQYTGVFTVRGYYTASPEKPFIMETIEKITTALRTIRGYSTTDGGLWALGLSITITFFGIIISPFAAVFAFMFSLIIIYAFGLSPLVTLPFITISMVLAFVIGSKVRS